MSLLANDKFVLELNERGAVRSLVMKEDPAAMNWVADPSYLKEVGYLELDKLFGEWSATVGGKSYSSIETVPDIRIVNGKRATVESVIGPLVVRMEYSLESEDLGWRINVSNLLTETIELEGFHVWFSLAYIMYRDRDVLRNMRQSCALFPHLGGDFSKFAAFRRSNESPHLGIYSTEGQTITLGSYCKYENRFLEQVSPSLDGVLHYRLSLVEDGSSFPELAESDWIYGEDYKAAAIAPGESLGWVYKFTPCNSQENFYSKAADNGHPRWSYSPVVTVGGKFEAVLTLPQHRSLQEARIWSLSDENDVVTKDVSADFKPVIGQPGAYKIILPQNMPGERKLEVVLDNGQVDVLVWNVLEPVNVILERRAEWLCRVSYDGEGSSKRPHAFLPLSNQGESIGKLSFLLLKNTLSKPVAEQVKKAESSAVFDMKQHWFEDGDFLKPRALYGSFYRIFDLDYIAHVYYLLSRMDDSLLTLNDSRTYLRWAAQVMCTRLDADCHDSQREKDETRLNGVFILYIRELLHDLKSAGMIEWYDKLSRLWEAFAHNLAADAQGFRGAITEHFYDNAGFGPTCEALCRIGLKEQADAYGQLILANIGFSNDYRAQNPDRWWEALSYMIHSLWGGMVAASARVAYEHLLDPAYLEASYRATMAVFNCYDWNVRSTPRRLEPGESASTFSVAAPNLNNPSLSRNRFGQSVFRNSNDPLFNDLFANASGDDWDMGEELVAYLLGFGTTTYLYRDKSGELRCVNGYMVEEDGGWLIFSYAAYPNKYLFLEQGLAYKAAQGETVPNIRLKDGKFIRVDEGRSLSQQSYCGKS